VSANIGMHGRYGSKTVPFILCHLVPGDSTLDFMKIMADTGHLKRFMYYCKKYIGFSG
jgi:hypothetical protein